MKPKISTGYLTPQANRIRRASTPTRSESINDLNDANESFFERLMTCPIKRQLILNLISSEKENIDEFKRKQEEKRKLLNGSPVVKVQKKHKCESPTALFRRRALEQLARQSPVSETASSTSGVERSRSNSRQSASSDCPSPIPFNKLLDGVVVYVEIRSKDKNQDRSTGAKALLSSMGATLKEQFTEDVSDVTHVVFKDGSFATYQKAKLMKIHLVSVLWIEAVRSSNSRVPEKKFPALGTEAYDHNVSSLCSQMQKDYEEIIREEVRRSMSTGTPLPSTKSLINRRRTIMTPFPSTSTQLSQGLPSTQDREVEDIICKGSRNHRYSTAEMTTPDLISDDDSDLGLCINGSVVNKRKLLPEDEVIFNSLENLQDQSNMELTNIDNSESLLRVKTRKSDENKNVMEMFVLNETLHIKEGCTMKENLSTDSIYNKTTPKLVSKGNGKLLQEISKGVGDNSFSKRRTRQLRGSIKTTSKNPSKQKHDNADQDTSLKILSKNSCNALAKDLNIEGNNTSTLLSSLQLSSEKNNAGVSTSTNMSSLQISSEINKELQDKVAKNAEKSTSTNMSSLQISINDKEKQVKESDTSTMSALVISTDSSKDILENSTKGKKSKPKQQEKSFNSTDDRSFTPVNPNMIQEVLQVLATPPPRDENVTKRRRGRPKKSISHSDNLTTEPVQKDRRKTLRGRIEHVNDKPSPAFPKKSLGARRKTIMPNIRGVESPVKKTEEFRSRIEVKSDSEVCTSKRTLRRKQKNNKEDTLLTSDESQQSGSEKKRKLRKLYNPEDSFGEDVSDEQERETKRLETEKQQLNKGVILNPVVVSVASNILVTAKTREFIEKNNINIQSVLDKQSESDEEDTSCKKGRKKKTETKAKVNSDADEQKQLAEEFLNKKPVKSRGKKSVAKSEGKIIKRRQSVRLTQRPRKTLKFNNSLSSEDDNKIVPNRRSTMEFQTLSQTKKRKLKIDKSKQPTIVCTRLHKDDIQIFNQIVKKLGGFVIEDEVSERTTHLVAGEPKRTVNMLRAIARGCWVLQHKWLLKSLEEGKWLPEEDYEETDFSPAVQKCRLQRQAFGPTFSMDLFKDCGPIFIARGSNPRCSDLRELVTMCQGKAVTIPRNAEIVVGEHVKYDGAKCVKETWLLDSITFNKRMPYKKYLISSGNDSPHV